MKLAAYILLLLVTIFIWLVGIVHISRKSIELHSEIENPPTTFVKVLIDVAYLTWAVSIIFFFALIVDKVSYLILG